MNIFPSFSGSLLVYLCFICLLLIILVTNNFSSSISLSSFILGFILVPFFLSICFFSTTPLNFLVFLELCVFPMIFLIFSYSNDLDNVSSTLFIFLLNILGSIPFMIFCSLSDSNLLMTHISSIINSYFYGSLILLCGGLILISKLPVFLIHFWLTNAHVSASGPSSIILASLILKLGSIGLLNFSFLFLCSCLNFLEFFLSFSLFSCLFVLTIILFSFDINFLVACSSILHIAMSLPLGVSSHVLGWLPVLITSVSHGLASLVLFFFLTLLYEFSMSRSITLVNCQESSSGLIFNWSSIFILINLGVPPFLNFLGEVIIFTYTIIFSYMSSILFSTIILFSLFFSIMVIQSIIFGNNYVVSESLESPFLGLLMKYYFSFLVLSLYLF